MYLTEETICYNINGGDLIYDLCTHDADVDPTTFDVEVARVGENSRYKNVILSDDFAINMGSYLDSSVKEYYCEVIQYVYNNWFDDGPANNSKKQNFTQLYSNLIDDGYSVRPEESNQIIKARLPLTQHQSAKITHRLTTQFGLTKHTCSNIQKTTFVCQNFNQQIKWFRIKTLRSETGDLFSDVSSHAPRYAFGSSKTEKAFANNINDEDDREGYLKAYPHTIMYMTPIYSDKIPRLLNTNKKITLQLSSRERIYGVDGYGLNCIVPIPKLNESNRYKAVFSSLNLSCSLRCGELNKPLISFALHFCCYGWDKSYYGYGGHKNDSTCTILTTNPFSYQANKVSNEAKLVSEQGAIIDIDGDEKNIRFCLLMSQMVEPTTSPTAYADNNNNMYGILGHANPTCEWNLVMDLYPI